MAENETRLEEDLYKKLSELIFNDVNDIKDDFINKALGGEKGIAEVQAAAERLKNKDNQEGYVYKIQKQKQTLKELIKQLDSTYEGKKYHYREAARDIESRLAGDPSKSILLESLRTELGIYIDTLKEQKADEETIYRRMIKFQKFISQALSLDIVFVHTSGEKASAKKYSRNIKLDKDILELLTFESDQKVSLSLEKNKKNSTENINLANIIKKAIDEEIKNGVLKRDKLEKAAEAIDNEERAYDEIRQNRFKTNIERRIAWVVSGYWQIEKVNNMGPIEEARQRILFQIHLDNVQKLFSSGLVEPERESGEIQKNVGKAEKEPKDKTLEIWIHHFVRSKWGIAGTDNRSGLIIDDTLLKTENLLSGVKKWLGINKGKKRDYVSIASKTDNPNFAGYTPFLDFINKLISYKGSKKKEKDKEILETFLKKKFFDDGARITGIAEDINEEAIAKLNEAFNSIF